MKIFSKRGGKLAPVVAIFAALILAACPPAPPCTSLCQATGDPTNPYEAISIDANNLGEHASHPNDLWPVPASGCPTSAITITSGKITTRHATSSETNPYNKITIT